MLENLYTTKMSANKKALQSRFSKIRSKSGRLSKMMTLVMSVTIAVTMLCATVVMAAVGNDGLEYWDKNEIYFRDGVTFSVNVSGRNVPAWVYDGIAGVDGNIDITITRYQTRDMKGHVSNERLIALSGSAGTVKLASNLWSGAGDTTSYGDEMDPQIKQYQYASGMWFIEYNNIGYAGVLEEPIMALTDMGEKKNRCVEVNFAFDENYALQTAFVQLMNADENDNPTNEKFDVLQADSGFSFIGNFETDYIKDITSDKSTNYYFTMYEDNYRNVETDGIAFHITKAAEDEIVVQSDVSLAKAEKIIIEVYDKDGREVAYSDRTHGNAIKPQYVLTPIKNNVPVATSSETLLLLRRI